MPELPEVETTKRGISPHIVNRKIKAVNIYHPTLRWPIEPTLPKILPGQKLHDIQRRGKYLALPFDTGTLLLHLGMSGSLRIVTAKDARQKHDHFEIIFSSKHILRLRDPRRFGAVIWCETDWNQHELIKHLGPEPLSEDFSGEHLYANSRNKTLAVKNYIMNSRIVVGVGNIYASESLFMAGINPKKAANKVSKKAYIKLGDSIKQVLRNSITQGGTTLKDFADPNGNPGYFALHLNVYGREGKECYQCSSKIKQCVIGQRSTYYCPKCQR